MSFDITDKIALITGGARDIGRAVTLELARNGAHTLINYHGSEADAAATQRAVEALGRRALCVRADVRKKADCERLTKAALEFGSGRIDILVNNAGGAGDLQPLAELSDAAFDEAMKWNVYANFWATRRALKSMLANHWGRIINISSIEGKHGKPVFTAYTAAKHAINGLTKSLAREVGTQGITVNAICPGLVITDIIRANGPATAKAMGMEFEAMIAMFAEESAIKRPNTVEEVAAMALLLASDAGAGITGAILSVDGGTAQY